MKSFEDFMIGLFIGSLFGIFVHSFIMSSQPSAMDVYQHKTTLQYKMNDSVKIDSIVVYKKDNIEIN